MDIIAQTSLRVMDVQKNQIYRAMKFICVTYHLKFLSVLSSFLLLLFLLSLLDVYGAAAVVAAEDVVRIHAHGSPKSQCILQSSIPRTECIHFIEIMIGQCTDMAEIDPQIL